MDVGSLYDWAAADMVDRGGRGLGGEGALPDRDAAKPGGASSAFAITAQLVFHKLCRKMESTLSVRYIVLERLQGIVNRYSYRWIRLKA